jgi:hypothetical protein
VLKTRKDSDDDDGDNDRDGDDEFLHSLFKDDILLEIVAYRRM